MGLVASFHCPPDTNAKPKPMSSTQPMSDKKRGRSSRSSAEEPPNEKRRAATASGSGRKQAQAEEDSQWTLQLPRTLAVLMRDLCERQSVEHFLTIRSTVSRTGRTIIMGSQWTVETSNEKHEVLPRWMANPELLQPEAEGELMVTMHTHPKAAVTQALGAVPSLRRRQQHARTRPLLYVPSPADVNNMLRYGMHVHVVLTPFHWFLCHVPRRVPRLAARIPD